MATESISHRRLVLLLALAWLVLNASVLLGGHVLPWDALDQFYPTVYTNAHALRSGEAPWWNPYIYSGYAAVGDPQGMLFAPLLMAWMLVPAHPGAWWFSVGVLLHVYMSGAAMLGVLRRHGSNTFGALLGATVYMAGGVAASRLSHVPIVIAYAWVPVVLLALRRLLEKPGAARGAWLGLAAGALVVQLVQVTYLFVLVMAVYALFAVLRAWPVLARAARWRLAAGLAVALVVTLALGLPQLVFTWASLALSNRVDLPLAAADAGSLDARALLFFIDPDAWGSLRDIHAAPVDPVQAFLYIGVVPMLALAGLARAWRRRGYRRAIVCFAALGTFAAVYMWGTHGPVYGWLYTWMPGLNHFRRPADAAYLLNVSLAFLTGIGASQIRLDDRRELTLLLGVGTAWFLAIAVASRMPAAVVLALISLVALWQLRKRAAIPRAALWFFALLVLDYRAFNFNGTFNDTANGAARFAAQPAVRFLGDALASGQGNGGERFTTQGATTLWDNMGETVGLASTQGYNPLRYALYEAWYAPRENAGLPVAPTPYNALPGARLDDLLGVRYVVAGASDSAQALPPDYTRVGRFKHVDVWRNDGAYPRFLSPVEPRLLGLGERPDPAAFAATDFAQVLWLTPRDEEDLSIAHADVAACRGHVAVEPHRVEASRTVLATHSASGGWLAMGELDHPGWKAELDGKPLAIHRANGLFRAVCVPAGDHELAFTFSPRRMVEYAWKHKTPL